ncbi:hypothetical protein Bca101_067512 [Brassica carinata]
MILSSERMDIPVSVAMKIPAKVIEVEGPRGKLTHDFKHRSKLPFPAHQRHRHRGETAQDLLVVRLIGSHKASVDPNHFEPF